VSVWHWLTDPDATLRRRADLWRLLGPRPALPYSPSGNLLRSIDTPFARIEHWALTINREELVPALLLLPVDQAPRGVVLYCHAHGNRFDIGKDELLHGRPSLQAPAYGDVLPAMGYAVLAIDHWCFGERAHHSERSTVKRLLWDGKTLWGYRVHDTLAALDWLALQPALSKLPIIALGLSMGSAMAVWAAALDERIAACIDLCCLADFDALLADGSFDLHGEYFFVPGLRREFSMREISALIAPRPHLSAIGRQDPLTPAAGVAAMNAAMHATYTAWGRPEHWQQHVSDSGHQETPAMRALVLEFLKRFRG
jgi:dienelactone hydrolase